MADLLNRVTGSKNAFAYISVALFLLAGLPATAQAAPRRVEGRFTATAFPYTQATGGAGTCLNGLEGVHKKTVPFRAPFGGLLEVELTGYSGYWFAYVTERSNHGYTEGDFSFLAEGDGGVLSVWLPGKRTYHLIACNFLGTPTATLTYSLREQPNAQTVSRPVGARTATHEYTLPSASTAAPVRFYGLCWGPLEVGCVGFDVGGERFVDIQIEDAGGTAVAAVVGQYLEPSEGWLETSICTSTTEPLRLHRDTSWISVEIVMGPCSDGTPTLATRGMVTATFSY